MKNVRIYVLLLYVFYLILYFNNKVDILDNASFLPLAYYIFTFLSLSPCLI